VSAPAFGVMNLRSSESSNPRSSVMAGRLCRVPTAADVAQASRYVARTSDYGRRSGRPLPEIILSTSGCANPCCRCPKVTRSDLANVFAHSSRIRSIPDARSSRRPTRPAEVCTKV
jgi:hypothetical protein